MAHFRRLYCATVALMFCLLFFRGVLAPGAYATYLPPDDFFESEDSYDIQVMAVQTTPNTPVESSTGLKGILIQLFGPYNPTITQLRYQSNTSTNYTYVNDISPDFPWLCSAGIFAIVLFCVFKLLGGVLTWLK